MGIHADEISVLSFDAALVILCCLVIGKNHSSHPTSCYFYITVIFENLCLCEVNTHAIKQKA